MKFTWNFKKQLKKFVFLFFLIFILTFQSNFQIVLGFPMDNYQSKIVIEELRLKVPGDLKEVWLESEMKIWEPWLSSQAGFLEREIFWDQRKEEALILVKWQNKNLWKKISTDQVNEIQKKFEEYVKNALKLNENPFKLINEGELYRQG